MKVLTILGIAFTVACTALAQEDPVESRRFPIAFLTTRAADAEGIPLGLAQDAIGTAVAAGEERGSGLLDPEELAAILKKEVAPASWSEPGASLEARDGQLIAVNRRSILDGIGTWLARARIRHGRRIVIEAVLVVVPVERWGRVAPKDLAQGAAILKTARLVASPGQRVLAQDLTQRSYLRDYDVQIATGAADLDPIVDVLNTGVRLDLRPWSSPGDEHVLIEVRAEAASLEAMDEKTIKLLITEPAPAPAAPAAAPGGGAVAHREWEGRVQLPRTPFERIRGQVVARPGETVVAAAASRADGVLVLLLTPSFAGEIAPAGLPETRTRIYEVGALTAKIQDYAAPRAELVGPGKGGGGPLTGAVFTLDEPREGYGEESLKADVKVAAPTAEAERVSGGGIAVRGNAENHAAVAKRLLEVFRREVRTVTTEAVVLTFSPRARAEWAKAVPALAPGGTRATDDEISKLLQEAGKSPELRLTAVFAVSGRLNQHVHVLSGRQQAYIQDYEPQVSASSACYDPIMGILLTGNGLEARPADRAGDGTTSVQLRVWTLAGELSEDKRVSSDCGPLQRPKVTGFLWQTEAVCAPGAWTLAALESRGTGPEAEEAALFVRVR